MLEGYPTLKSLQGKRLGGLTGLADWAARLGRLPHLSCKELHIIKQYQQSSGEKKKIGKILFLTDLLKASSIVCSSLIFQC